MSTSYEDKAEIRELLSSYCFRMDDGDFAGVAALFTPDGDWLTPYMEVHGREELTEILTRINPEKGVGPVRKHTIPNSVITLDGDTATARTSYVVFATGEAGPEASVVGTYEDKLVRAGDSWLIAERRILHEIVGELKLRL